MNIAFLDDSFTLIKYINYINLQWIRRYYEPGEFCLQIPASEYDNSAAYVFTKDRPEVGIIQKRTYTAGYDGEVIELSGYFYEYKLNDKITFPRYTGTGTAEALALAIVTAYKDDIPLLEVGDEVGLGESITKQTTGAGLATVLYEMLETQELSFRCVYDYEANTMTFTVWQGADRTQDQSTNSFATFSGSFRNLKDEEVTVDGSNFKNYAVVIGNGDYEDGNQIEVDVDLRDSTSDYAQILYVDQTSMKYDSEEQTLAEYQAQLYEAGVEALAKYVDIANVSFSAVDKGLAYLTDYDLGDKCDVILDSVQQSFTMRITEIDEVFKQGQHTVSLQFGDKVPTVYAKSRR